jgi:hypothetical protein
VEKRHTYCVRVTWTGNQGAGTANYRGYSGRTRSPRRASPVLPGHLIRVFAATQRGGIPKNCSWRPLPHVISFGISACALRPALSLFHTKTMQKAL